MREWRCKEIPQWRSGIPDVSLGTLAGSLQSQDYGGPGEKKHTPPLGAHHSIPVWVGGGQHELEFHHAGAVRELPVLQAV